LEKHSSKNENVVGHDFLSATEHKIC